MKAVAQFLLQPGVLLHQSFLLFQGRLAQPHRVGDHGRDDAEQAQFLL